MKLFNEVNDPQTNSQIEEIEKEYNFRFPPHFREFLLSYYPFQLSFENVDNSKIVVYLNLFQGQVVVPEFIDFSTFRRLADANFEADEQEYGWKLIKIFKNDANPYAGIYLGIGEHNRDVIYHIDEGNFSPDYDYPINTEELQNCLKPAITRLTKDIYSFTKFLQIVPNQFELVDFEWE